MAVKSFNRNCDERPMWRKKGQQGETCDGTVSSDFVTFGSTMAGV